MRTKISLILSLLCLPLAFWACGDDSSSGASADDYSAVSDLESSSSSSKDVIASSSAAKQSASSSSEANVASCSSVKEIASSSSSEDKAASGYSAKSSSSIKMVAWDYLNSEISYGEFSDVRDDQVYKTVKIGNQTWMAENLNYADSVNTASLKGKSWCFDNKDANCDVTGRFYTWAAAIDSAALANDTENPQTCGYGQSCGRLTSTALAEAPIQGICPSGWHLPSKTEWQVLFTAVGGSGNAGKALKSGSGWYSNGNGTDAYGFSALPAGSGDYDGDFYGAGRSAYFWSATRYEYSCYYAFYMDLDYNYEYAYLGYGDKGNAFSIRCLKND